MKIVTAIMFLISPLFSVLYFFRRYNSVITKNLIWVFIVFYGFTFVISNDTMDANRLLSRFELALQFKGDIWGYYFRLFVFGDNKVNFIEPFITYLVALITNSFQVLMAVYSLIFGYFYSRNICYLLEYSRKSKIKLYNYLIVFAFIFVIGYWSVNMFRFWTATHVFFYALIPYFVENKKNKLWWLVFAFLLHYSFLLPIVFFVIYYLLGNRTKFYFYFFIISYFINSINVEQAGDLMLKVLPTNFENKISAVMSENALARDELLEEGIAAKLRYLLFFAVNLIYMFIYYFHRTEIKNIQWLNSLFNFTLVLLLVGNLGELIPRGGSRFTIVAVLFCLSFLFYFIQNIKIYGPLRQILNFISPFIFIGTLGFIRFALDTTNIIAILGNPILIFFINPNKALIHYLPFL